MTLTAIDLWLEELLSRFFQCSVEICTWQQDWGSFPIDCEVPNTQRIVASPDKRMKYLQNDADKGFENATSKSNRVLLWILKIPMQVRYPQSNRRPSLGMRGFSHAFQHLQILDLAVQWQVGNSPYRRHYILGFRSGHDTSHGPAAWSKRTLSNYECLLHIPSGNFTMILSAHIIILYFSV
jgi:hypothetical protein